ncbi:MAG: PASTA domain-containing protein [Candidatus Fermentibacteraceae bacterium]|nr:PASTA domain-containing protein [Candidatus Fermentibacteraceae bacterium]MBN2608270.1 PASTA domain-containing protein [Candidatus Fermentibacteraceae bacterium]
MRSALRFGILALSGAVLAFLAGTLLAPSIFETPRFISSIGAASAPVTVPDVIGLSRQDAQREVESASLVLAGQWSEYGPMESMGSVIRQDPPPGAMTPRGAPVSIFWNIGPLYRQYYPDSLIGMSAVDAEEKIADWQLYSIGRSWVPHPAVPEGMVVGVCPRQYDSLSVTTPVRLLVSTGWEGMPRFQGLSESGARELAERNRLVMVVQERTTGDILQDGIVIEQLTPAGTRFAPGDSVVVVVGRTDGEWGTW